MILADLSTVRARATRRNRVSAIATGFALLLAGLLAWKMWDAYMLGPWTRDATVRAYVITEVPEVSGQITQLAVHADQCVHKGDLLLEIDPTDYEIAVSQSEATVRQAQGERAKHRRANYSSARTDQCQPSATTAGASRARICGAVGRPLPNPREAGLGYRSECPAVYVAAASAGSSGAVCARKPQSGDAASRIAESAAPDCRGDFSRKPKPS